MVMMAVIMVWLLRWLMGSGYDGGGCSGIGGGDSGLCVCL